MPDHPHPSFAGEQPPRGLVLLGGPRPRVETWVARSVVPVVIAPQREWTAVVTAGPSPLDAPYQDAAMLLAARAIPKAAGPAMGFFVLDGRASVTVHGRRGRNRIRWLVWDPDEGVLDPPELRQARPSDVLRTAGAAPALRRELIELLAQRQVHPVAMLRALLATLELPGAHFLAEPKRAVTAPGALAHRPQDREIGWFSSAVADSVRLRKEFGVLS